MTVAIRMVASEIGTWSLSGAQLKTPVSQRPVLSCGTCGGWIAGHVDGRHAVFDPEAKPRYRKDSDAE